MLKTINDSNFYDEVLNSKLPVMVDFSAEWCGPCQMQSPIVEILEKEYKDKAKILKMDVDQSGSTAGQYNVMTLPSFIFFRDGEPIANLTGSQTKKTLEEKLDSL